MSALMLAMGLCLIGDGYSEISEASKVSKSPPFVFNQPQNESQFPHTAEPARQKARRAHHLTFSAI